jgi:hypothetical protein
MTTGAWREYREDATLGSAGSEDGTIVRDEEHSDGARITLERDTPRVPFAITCGVYGWVVHTRFLTTEQEAVGQFELMKKGLEQVLDAIPYKHEMGDDAKVERARNVCGDFVERFP